MDFPQQRKAKCVASASGVSRMWNALNPRVFKAPLFALIILCGSLTLHAQVSEAGSATVNDSYEITLDTEKALSHIYEADISQLNFFSEEQAKGTFAQLDSPACNIVVQWADKKIEIIIHPDPIHEGWTVAQWNEHFKEMAQTIGQN